MIMQLLRNDISKGEEPPIAVPSAYKDAEDDKLRVTSQSLLRRHITSAQLIL